MRTSVKFTIIIPTRERADVLVHSLHTVVAQDYEDLTIIVSDNFSQDNTKQVVDSFHDPRIKYINTGRRVSMSHNWEFALSHVKDGWVSIIGDDDGLMPGALTTVADIIRKTGCQAITSLERGCFYNWPGTMEYGDQLMVPLHKGIEWRDAREWLGKVMKGEAAYEELPFLYIGGFIDSRIINKGRSSEGVFYLSMSPDIYSAVVFASILEDYVMLKEPVVIAGMSSHSAGASGFCIINDQGPANKFYSEDNIPFDSRLTHKNLPKSIPIAIYEAYLQSAHVHNDFLKIKMEDQLALALSKIALDEDVVLRKYCVDIANRNGIDMSIVYRREKEFRKVQARWKLLKCLKERIYRCFNYRVLSGKEYGIQDIYGASILAKAIYLEETCYKRWRLKKILRRVRKLFGNCN